MISTRQGALAAASAFALFACGQAHAQSTVYTTPNLTTATGAQSVSLGGQTFTNQGLVGVGRLAATTRDFAGETLGSFSGMAMDLGSWRRRADGTYSGKMFTLPDRGPNDVGPFVGTTNYRNRVHTHDLVLAPYTGSANLPAATASQNQLAITPTGGFLLTDANGQNFTGKDAGSNVITRGGIQYPSPATGEGAGRISMDSEAIAFLGDGSFYISDEYAAGIYYFDRTGRQIGAIQTVSALLPRTAGVVDMNGVNPPASGRRNNQGLEALAVTPDGGKLVTILQSATVQDTGPGNQGRNNTRILVYDIASSRTPTNPVEHYVLQLPIVSAPGIGGAPTAAAAQSEMLALNANQFLVLSRDGVGRGSGANAANSPVYKSVLLVDTTGATNLAGTAFENTATGAVSPGGVLNTTIKPVQQVQLVNMLNPVQLGKFGLNLKTAPSDILSVSEKWEAMGLVPVLEENAPRDFFLLVGNDNDFMANNGRINGQDFDASLSGAGGTGNNDSLVLVYRLTLPTYVDPMALSAMKAAVPAATVVAGAAALDLGSAASTAALEDISALRRAGGFADAAPRIWVQGDWSSLETPAGGGLAALSADGAGFAFGVDWSLSGHIRLGAAAAYRSLDGDFGAGYSLEADAMSFSLYGGYADAQGLYVQAAAALVGKVDFDEIARPGAYGLIASGETTAQGGSFSAEAGWAPQLGAFRLGPYIGVGVSRIETNAYTETGASLGNATIGEHSTNRTWFTAGVEASGRLGNVLPSLRLGYVSESDDDETVGSRLASADHVMATQSLSLPSLADDYAVAELALAGETAGFGWRAGVGARFADETSARVTFAVARRF
ncbi:esterase-like activity of phytase family protein [Phenylobacterium sp.]|uniref:esterase-like activity of phytase family protein n=1 Tax=Phenylobacterium sp. TaxID=1871053 RepID=UPI00286BD7E8|nr:esterase-like activity of phytase family protein [Phenylobacterium sp.]